MRLIHLITILLIFSPSVGNSKDIQTFNTSILGSSVEEKIIPLVNTKKQNTNLIVPKAVHLDIKDNFYNASTVYYFKNDISYTELVNYMDNIYPGTKNHRLSGDGFSTWRIEEKRFVVCVFPSPIDDDYVEVTYCKFNDF